MFFFGLVVLQRIQTIAVVFTYILRLKQEWGERVRYPITPDRKYYV